MTRLILAVACVLSLSLATAALADKPVFRELKPGDIIEHGQVVRVYASPQTASPAPQPPATPVAVAAPQAQPAPVVAYGDPYGFGAWLNGQRASRGLHPLAHDSGLSNDAAVNSSRGFGHSFMGRARRQNAGLGQGSQVWPMWIASPLHAAALFDRSITAYGIACINGVWTYSAY